MLERLSNIQVVLVRSKFPENIGAAARAIANMGLGGLRLVAPERLWPEPMARLASSGGQAVLAAMQVYPDLASALGDCLAALATTARVGRRRGRLSSPRRLAPQMLELAEMGKVALVFGPEDKGLSTEEVDACGFTCSIPTAEAASLNVAQAVVVLAYEMRQAALEASEEGLGAPTRPKPASLEELEGLKQHLQEALVEMGAISPENPAHFFRPFKTTLERSGITSREVRAWHGLARQALWLSGQIKKGRGKPGQG